MQNPYSKEKYRIISVFIIFSHSFAHSPVRSRFLRYRLLKNGDSLVHPMLHAVAQITLHVITKECYCYWIKEEVFCHYIITIIIVLLDDLNELFCCNLLPLILNSSDKFASFTSKSWKKNIVQIQSIILFRNVICVHYIAIL